MAKGSDHFVQAIWRQRCDSCARSHLFNSASQPRKYWFLSRRLLPVQQDISDRAKRTKLFAIKRGRHKQLWYFGELIRVYDESCSGWRIVNLPEQRFVFLRKWYREFHRKRGYANTTS